MIFFNFSSMFFNTEYSDNLSSSSEIAYGIETVFLLKGT
jgi:hypothetical protein